MQCSKSLALRGGIAVKNRLLGISVRIVSGVSTVAADRQTMSIADGNACTSLKANGQKRQIHKIATRRRSDGLLSLMATADARCGRRNSEESGD